MLRSPERRLIEGTDAEEYMVLNKTIGVAERPKANEEVGKTKIRHELLSTYVNEKLLNTKMLKDQKGISEK